MSKEIVNLNVPKVKGVSTVTNPGNEKKGFAQELLETTQEAVKTKAAAQVLGIDIAPAAPVSKEVETKEDPLATQIVTKSMETQTRLIENMEKQTFELQKEVKAANQSASEMQFALLQQQLTQIQTAQAKTDESAKAALGAGAPKSAFEHYNSVKGELQKLISDLPQQRAEAAPAGMSDATTIRLKELEFEQSRALAQITADNTRAQQAFNLQLAEFSDNKELKRMEYQDKRAFRQEGLAGITDLVSAIGQGIKEGGGPGVETEETTATPKKVAEGADMGAFISSFQCSVCGTEVGVKEGDETAKCPNSECNAGFTIKATQ